MGIEVPRSSLKMAGITPLEEGQANTPKNRCHRDEVHPTRDRFFLLNFDLNIEDHFGWLNPDLNGLEQIKYFSLFRCV